MQIVIVAVLVIALVVLFVVRGKGKKK